MEEWLPIITSAGGPLIGVLIGGWITHRAQLAKQRADIAQERAGLAAGISAEIDAFLGLMSRRRQSERADPLLQLLRAGNDVTLKQGWIAPHEKDWNPFPFFTANLARIGTLGRVCGPLARFHSLYAGVRSTLMSADAGAFESLSIQGKIDLISGELKIWQEVRELGHEIITTLEPLQTG